MIKDLSIPFGGGNGFEEENDEAESQVNSQKSFKEDKCDDKLTFKNLGPISYSICCMRRFTLICANCFII